MPAFFACTLFVGSALLFLIQPMIAKMLLPRLGGSPAVWNTCMVFFQALLLAGYGYAHLISSRLRPRGQAVLHLGLLALPCLLFLLPIAIPADAVPPVDSNPSWWLLGTLFLAVGLPFFVVSANAPLLQMWFACTGHPSAKDPYFLYGASNLGSMLALLSYPLVLEPWLTLAGQGVLWTAGYGLLGALLLGCAFIVWRMPGSAESPPNAVPSEKRSLSAAKKSPVERLTVGRRLRWVALAFVPSSLMLSVTTYLTTDIAAIPLLWVIPLALYLLSFIIVFARRPLVSQRLLSEALPRTVLLLILILLTEATEPVWLLMSLHLLGLFVVALACHGGLAADRPSTSHLTEFYLWLSVGGVLGGMFNALAAPLLFSSVAEYPLVLVLACLLQKRPGGAADSPQSRVLDWGLPLALFTLTAALVQGLQGFGLEAGILSVALMFVVPTLLCYTFLYRPLRLSLGIAALLLASSYYNGVYGRVLYRERDFFGVHRVTLDPEGGFRQLVHGNTVHGKQSLKPSRRHQPLAYFYQTAGVPPNFVAGIVGDLCMPVGASPFFTCYELFNGLTFSSPIGQIFEAFSGTSAKAEVAVVGLGTGSMTAYAEPNQHWTIFEIDPVVARIASGDSPYFSYVQDCVIGPRIILGDGRLSLAREKDHRFGIIALDAFSSDTIPVHLLTREALRMYLDKMTADGILAFHTSNRYLDLEPVLGDLARDANLVCLAQNDLKISPAEKQDGKFGWSWVIMAHKREHLGALANDPRWHAPLQRPNTSVWTDDFSNLIQVFEWRETPIE